MASSAEVGSRKQHNEGSVIPLYLYSNIRFFVEIAEDYTSCPFVCLCMEPAGNKLFPKSHPTALGGTLYLQTIVRLDYDPSNDMPVTMA